ncbi:type II toxin-antitoxin system PemK/MazF family toxin [Actinoplanes sp. NPDC026670]|uniref:type II toxin-antitoxin system PemK/MazF family toxin n=1 Tax=Actinoplanes sp. NPDC026670 TaxID=3154700 RepID=UPI0033CDF075
MSREPLRGEVWNVALPNPIGKHPAVILSINRLNDQLNAITILVITGTPGPPYTHIPIGPSAGVKKYRVSFVNVTDMHTVARGRAYEHLGRLHPPTELAHVEDQVRVYLGL